MIEEGVYGRNDPPSEDTGEPTARDFDPDNVHPDHPVKGTGEELHEVRERDAEQMKTGGMGRQMTPKGGPTQGEWEHTEEVPQNEHVQKVAENETDTDQYPS